MQYDPLFQRINQGIHYVESSYLDQDADAIYQMRQRQQQQTFTCSNDNFNNMNTEVRMDYMGIYVESTLIEVRNV